jgi:hypothetical protein
MDFPQAGLPNEKHMALLFNERGWLATNRSW